MINQLLRENYWNEAEVVIRDFAQRNKIEKHYFNNKSDSVKAAKEFLLDMIECEIESLRSKAYELPPNLQRNFNVEASFPYSISIDEIVENIPFALESNDVKQQIIEICVESLTLELKIVKDNGSRVFQQKVILEEMKQVRAKVTEEVLQERDFNNLYELVLRLEKENIKESNFTPRDYLFKD